MGRATARSSSARAKGGETYDRLNPRDNNALRLRQGKLALRRTSAKSIGNQEKTQNLEAV